MENMISVVEAAVAEGKKELPNLKKGMFAKVAENIQQIKDSKYLATICLDVPGTMLDAEALKVETPDYAKLAEIFGELEFRKMRDEVRAKIGNDSLFAEQSAPVPQAMQQTGGHELSESEMSEKNSCVLNVWTTDKRGHRPVMVWLHGGGFDSGSSAWDPGQNLAKKDVVVVGVNHRLNILGFLDLSSVSAQYRYSGNVGMLDIIH